MNDEHTFLMDLQPRASGSSVHLDGIDISNLIAGVMVSSHVSGLTQVHLFPAPGRRAHLMVKVPEASIVIENADAMREVARAFTQAVHDVVKLLNEQGLACPSSLAFAAEQARNLVGL